MIPHLGHQNRILKLICPLFALAFPLTLVFAQSSSQQSSDQSQPPAQSPPATLDPPPPKQDSLGEAARKAKAKKTEAPTAPNAPKGKVYAEDDLKSMKGPGVSVIGDPPRRTTRRSRPVDDPDGDNGQNSEEYWRGRARQYLDAIAQLDEQIAQKKDEIKKFGSGGFDVTTGMKDNVAYINDRNAQLKQLEARKVEVEKEFEELQDEGRKAGVPSSWFR